MSKNATTAKQIKDAFMKESLKKEKHPLPWAPEIGVMVYELTSYELETWRELNKSEDDNMRRLNAARLLQHSLHDEDGNPVFGEKEIAIIGGRPARMIEPLVRIILRLSGYGAEGDMAVLKNLRKILGAAGLSDLLESSDAPSGSSADDTPPESSESST